ncbi:hypothetical protein EVAR_44550_1 [Eumeta japonica]|uniref:Uncharacterized protein n=1 Tax=Eumeta variegata TaxID=151549 RepID=A0A4C1XBS4_EUMVA|nr:hypothetical protein EVAR_44550_1 [Eumeta japonica]
MCPRVTRHLKVLRVSASTRDVFAQGCAVRVPQINSTIFLVEKKIVTTRRRKPVKGAHAWAGGAHHDHPDIKGPRSRTRPAAEVLKKYECRKGPVVRADARRRTTFRLIRAVSEGPARRPAAARARRSLSAIDSARRGRGRGGGGVRGVRGAGQGESRMSTPPLTFMGPGTRAASSRAVRRIKTRKQDERRPMKDSPKPN